MKCVPLQGLQEKQLQSVVWEMYRIKKLICKNLVIWQSKQLPDSITLRISDHFSDHWER